MNFVFAPAKYLGALAISVCLTVPVLLLLAFAVALDTGFVWALIGTLCAISPFLLVGFLLKRYLEPAWRWYRSREGAPYRALTLLPGPVLVIMFSGISAASDKNRSTNLTLVALAVTLTLGLIVYEVVASVLHYRREAEAQADVEVAGIYDLLRSRNVVAASLVAICQSCQSFNILELGAGQPCEHCRAHVSREWGV